MAIKKVTLEKVSRFTKDKEGRAFRTKDGRNYERVLITVKGKTLSGFGAPWNEGWHEGDEVSIDITSVEKDGKTYYNFGPVNMTTQLVHRVDELEKRVEILEKAYPVTSAGTKVPDFNEVDIPEEPPVDEIRPEDIPF